MTATTTPVAPAPAPAVRPERSVPRAGWMVIGAVVSSTDAAATFAVMLEAASAQTITVAYATGNGTAAAGSDYVARSLVGETIPAGMTSGTFEVAIAPRRGCGCPLGGGRAEGLQADSSWNSCYVRFV